MNSSKNSWIARLLATGILLAPAIAEAAEFVPGRGISMDQWVTWPDAARWNEPDIIENFPEWQSFVSDDEIASLKQAGLTTVRMPVDPAMFLYDDDPERQAALFASVHRAIERIAEQDLNIIVDLHTISRFDSEQAIGVSQILDDDLTFVTYLALVEKMAAELAKYDPESVALELINEPAYDCYQTDLVALWYAQLSQLHAAARKANDKISLVLSGACHGSAYALTQFDPAQFNDDNILWTFHTYAPFILTHQSADWVGKPVSAFQNLPYPPSNLTAHTVENMPRVNGEFINGTLRGSERSDAGWYIRNEFEKWGSEDRLGPYMQKRFVTVANWAAKHEIDPASIYLGEFGFIAQEYGKRFKTDPAWRLAYLNDMIALAEQHGFGWSIWSFGGAFGMVQTFGGEPMPGNLLMQLNLKAKTEG